MAQYAPGLESKNTTTRVNKTQGQGIPIAILAVVAVTTVVPTGVVAVVAVVVVAVVETMTDSILSKKELFDSVTEFS